MNKSEQIGDLAGALAKAQGEIKGAAKDSANPHFKSRYADLAAVWDACREALSKNAIAVVQMPSISDGKVAVTTLLTHSSGQWIEETVSVAPMKMDAQGLGSVVTYLRRYALAAAVGVAPEDDDGEAGVGRGKDNRTQNGSGQPRAPLTPPAPTVPPPSAEVNMPDAGPHVTWAKQRLAELDKDMTVDELEAWHQKHRPALEKLHQKDHDLAMRVTEKYNARWKLPPMAAA